MASTNTLEGCLAIEKPYGTLLKLIKDFRKRRKNDILPHKRKELKDFYKRLKADYRAFQRAKHGKDSKSGLISLSNYAMRWEQCLGLVNECTGGKFRTHSINGCDYTDLTDLKTAQKQKHVEKNDDGSIKNISYASVVDNIGGKLAGIRAVISSQTETYFAIIPEECFTLKDGTKQKSLSFGWDGDEISLESPVWPCLCTFDELCFTHNDDFLSHFEKQKKIQTQLLFEKRDQKVEEGLSIMKTQKLTLTELFLSKKIPSLSNYYTGKNASEHLCLTDQQKFELINTSEKIKAAKEKEKKDPEFKKMLNIAKTALPTSKHELLTLYHGSTKEALSKTWLTKNEGRYYFTEEQVQILVDILEKNKKVRQLKDFEDFCEAVKNSGYTTQAQILSPNSGIPFKSRITSVKGVYGFDGIIGWKNRMIEILNQNKLQVAA